MGKLPLNDPRWCPMQAAIELRQGQTGAMPLAITDLEHAMESGKLRSMRRDITTGACEELEASFWVDHLIDVSIGAVVIYRDYSKHDPQRWAFFAHHHDQRVDGHAYYVWRPDLDNLYPVSRTRADHEDEPLLPIDRAKTVLFYLYRTKAQMPHSLKEATRKVEEECKKRGWRPVSSTDTVSAPPNNSDTERSANANSPHRNGPSPISQARKHATACVHALLRKHVISNTTVSHTSTTWRTVDGPPRNDRPQAGC
jgi:hypothetical protein